MNNKLINLMSAAICAGVFAAPASAAFIEASASCSSTSSDPVGAGCDQSVSDDYGFNFKVEDTSTTGLFKATLTNTSPNTSPFAQIDLLAFNLNPNLALGTDFTIQNVVPDWIFSAGSGGVSFDYVGEADAPGDKIQPEAALTFDIVLSSSFILATGYTTFLDYFLNAENDLGTGIGGGGDSGEVAVSFQTLGTRGDDSDLLVAFWRTEDGGGGGPQAAPEPGVLLLMGAGLLGLGMARRRKSA